MTPEDLQAAMPFSGARSHVYAKPLGDAMFEFGITTPQRRSAFLAQIAHESGSLRYVLELASGDAYEGRADLGNVRPGDGRRFKGRGLMQITGRANYGKCAIALGMDLLTRPELLELPVGACRSAGWYWQIRNLNAFADRDEFGALTKAINGGYTHIDDRIAHWLTARKALGL